MSVLGTNEIINRLDKGEIFRQDTWDASCVQEACYDLRVATDFLIIKGKAYPHGVNYDEPYIDIGCGEIALLSTMEVLNMPSDLVGELGIKFKFSSQGLTSLFAPVDPKYGTQHPNERLYLVVANLDPEPIVIRPGERVFTLVLHEVKGEIRQSESHEVRGSVGGRLEQTFFRRPARPFVGFIERLNDRIEKVEATERHIQEFEGRIAGVERGFQQITLFGIVLVAASLFGVVIATLLAFLFSYLERMPTELLAGISSWLWVVPVGLFVSIVVIAAWVGAALRSAVNELRKKDAKPAKSESPPA